MESYSSFDTITSGIFARAQPETVVRSAFKQIIACGAHLLDFREYIVYAPTLLPTPKGKTRIFSARYLPKRSCFSSLILPVFLSTAPRKFIGFFETRVIP